MEYLVQILEVKPCGCDAEGMVSAELENGFPLWFYYQGSDAQAASCFPVGKFVRVELVGNLCSVTATEKCIPSVTFPNSNYYFEACGLISGIAQSEGEMRYNLASEIRLLFENEDERLAISCGEFVSVKGELWANNWWS